MRYLVAPVLRLASANRGKIRERAVVEHVVVGAYPLLSIEHVLFIILFINGFMRQTTKEHFTLHQTAS